MNDWDNEDIGDDNRDREDLIDDEAPKDDDNEEESMDDDLNPFDGDDDRSMFADPGGHSALRAASKSNPRNLPCPTCKQPNRLTPKDRTLGYQCDSCADRAERGLAFDD